MTCKVTDFSRFFRSREPAFTARFFLKFFHGFLLQKISKKELKQTAQSGLVTSFSEVKFRLLNRIFILMFLITILSITLESRRDFPVRILNFKKLKDDFLIIVNHINNLLIPFRFSNYRNCLL